MTKKKVVRNFGGWKWKMASGGDGRPWSPGDETLFQMMINRSVIKGPVIKRWLCAPIFSHFH